MNKRDIENDFEVVYDGYGNTLYKIAFLYLGSKDDAEDVLQDVFIKYLKGNYSFKSLEHEKAWFIRVTRNRCLDLLKRAGRKNISLEDLQIAACNDTDSAQDVLKEVIALPEKYKTALLLYYYEGYSVKEIAGLLKASQSAIKKRLQRAREILKIELEDYDYEKR